MNKRVLRLGTLFAVYVSLSSPALAYLDGATASILLQAMIGTVATWLMYSRLFAASAKTFFFRLIGKTAKMAKTPDAE